MEIPCIGHTAKGFAVVEAVSGRTLQSFEGLSLRAVSPDGTWALASAGNKDLTLVNLRTGARGLNFREDAYLTALSENGARIATSVGVSTMTVRESRKGAVLASWKLRSQFAVAPVFSRDGRLLATASGRNVRVLDVATGKVASALQLPVKTDVFVLAVSPDGSRVLASGEPGSVSFCERGKAATLPAHAGRVYAVAFAPDGTFASAGRDAVVRLWSASGEPMRVLGEPREVPEFHPRDEMEGDADAFDQQTIFWLQFSTDGARVAALSRTTLTVWSVADGKRLGEFPRPASLSGWRGLGFR